MTTDPSVIEAELSVALQALAPGYGLARQGVPDLPGQWFLLDPEQAPALDSQATGRVMATPPFWSVMWPAGRVLAQKILAGEIDVQGKRVADFGCGCGVIAVCAAMAGADAWAFDLDRNAQRSTVYHATLADVSVRLGADFFLDPDGFDVVFVADVFYDDANRPLLDRIRAHTKQLLVADCRAHDLHDLGLQKTTEARSAIWPDLDPSDQFRHVSVYHG